MRILLWHVHGPWSRSFVQGAHDYLIPTMPDGGPDGMLQEQGFTWPRSVVRVPAADLGDLEVDAVLLQRPQEIGLVRRWLGREPGRDIPAVYVEHSPPRGDVPLVRHPVADSEGIVLVHVAHFNAVMWDNGAAPTRVIEPGVLDPGPIYTGELARAGVVLNDPLRRWRITGADLLRRFAEVSPIDVFGRHVNSVPDRIGPAEHEIRIVSDPPRDVLHRELATRRVYVQPGRWTSLGLSLLEAMHLGMPVVALATAEMSEALPADAGCVSTRIDVLQDAVEEFCRDPELARESGERARAAALARYGIDRFLAEWDTLLDDVAPAPNLVSAW